MLQGKTDHSEHSSPWVRRVVGALEALRGEMRVNLRCGQMRMPEQFLYAAQISTRVEQVCRVAVPQLVRSKPRIKAR